MPCLQVGTPEFENFIFKSTIWGYFLPITKSEYTTAYQKRVSPSI